MSFTSSVSSSVGAWLCDVVEIARQLKHDNLSWFAAYREIQCFSTDNHIFPVHFHLIISWPWCSSNNLSKYFKIKYIEVYKIYKIDKNFTCVNSEYTLCNTETAKCAFIYPFCFPAKTVCALFSCVPQPTSFSSFDLQQI